MHGLCLDVPWASFWNGNQLWMWGCSNNNNVAQMYSTPGTSWFGPIMVGGKCLDVYFASQANGASIVVHDCNWGANQMWLMDSLGRLRPMHAWWKCADIPGGDWGWGARIWLWDCHSGLNQQWQLGRDDTDSSQLLETYYVEG